MIAFDRVERLIGPNGEWMPEATSDDADPMAYKYRYVPSAPITNWAEKARLDALEDYKQSQGEDANINGVFFRVERVDY